MQMRYFEWLDRVAMLVEGAQASGELSTDIDPKLAAQTIVAAVDGIGARVMLAGYDIPARQQRAIIDNVIDNLPLGDGRPTKLPGKLRRKRQNGDAAGRP
jgi:hypothetical protein